MTKTARWVGILAATAALQAVVFLAVTGVPKPSSIVAEDVGRVAWLPLAEISLQRVTARKSESLVGWMPDGSGLLAMSSRMLFDFRMHSVSRAGGPSTFIPEIPRNAAVYTQPGRDYMVLGSDRDGDEQFQLYRWDLGGADPVLLTSNEERASFGAFEPNGDRIAYTSTRRNGKDADIYLVDVLDPSSDRLVAEMEGMWRVAGWSPDSDDLLLAKAASNLAVELYLFDVADNVLTPLSEPSERPVRVVSPRWSRDGSALYYASDRAAEFTQLRRLDLATRVETTLTADIDWDVESVQQSGDGSILLIAVNEDGSLRYYTSRADGGDRQPLDLFETGSFQAAFHPTEPVMLVNHTDSRGRVRGYVYDLRSRELELWVGGEAEESELPEPRLVRYETFDEVDGDRRTIPAFVYPGVGEGPRPVLIDIHGGPEAQARLKSGQGAMQKRGITVIAPNVRGSMGYGRTYVGLDDWELREDAVRDIGSLLDWIAEQPDLDEDRVVVKGGSYGGYMVLASLVHYSSRLRCGIDVVGVSNFVTFLENTADYRKDLRRAEYGDERIPEMRAFLEEIAPLNNAERITSRLMVVQGANDPRVPLGEARQIVSAVRGNGFDVSYIEGKNEGHGFRQPWNAMWAGLAQQALVRECLLEG